MTFTFTSLLLLGSTRPEFLSLEKYQLLTTSVCLGLAGFHPFPPTPYFISRISKCVLCTSEFDTLLLFHPLALGDEEEGNLNPCLQRTQAWDSGTRIIAVNPVIIFQEELLVPKQLVWFTSLSTITAVFKPFPLLAKPASFVPTETIPYQELSGTSGFPDSQHRCCGRGAETGLRAVLRTASQ